MYVLGSVPDITEAEMTKTEEREKLFNLEVQKIYLIKLHVFSFQLTLNQIRELLVSSKAMCTTTVPARLLCYPGL